MDKIIRDFKTNTIPEKDFGIKVQFDSSSILLNSEKATNFIYELTKPLKEHEIIEINGIKRFADKFDKFREYDCKLNFIATEQAIFQNNLILIDSFLPNMIANMLIQYYDARKPYISDLIKILNVLNPIGYDLSYLENVYEYKVKHLLTDIALGLMPSKVWTGKYDATGGYLIVKKDGDVLAYHIYNKNEFENYLFFNTQLETASTSRFGFGNIYSEMGKQYMKLNLQIRFIK